VFLRQMTPLTKVCSPVDCLPFLLIFGTHIGTFAQEQVHHLQKYKWINQCLSAFLASIATYSPMDCVILS